MDKIVSVSSLKKVTNGIINKIDDLIDERLDGKSFKYLTLAEYEALSDAEKNDDTIVYHITDAQLSYNDLIDLPEIPSSVSQLNNDSGFLTEIPEEYITEEELEAKGYTTSSQIPTNVSQLNNDSGFATETYVNNNISNLQERIDELFQNVNNGKELVASAIIDKGIDASGDETFQSLSHKISQIPVGAPGSNIIGYINEENEVYVSLTELESGTYTLKFEDYDGLLTDFDDIGEVEVE